MRLYQLIEDERGQLSSARCGMWGTFLLGVFVVLWDVHLTSIDKAVHNTVFAFLTAVFTFFALWAMGPRMAQYLGPQIGQMVQGLASSVRDARLPSNKTDDERGATP